jgi:deaminated glutathione amidase
MKVKVAAVQIGSMGSKEENLEKIRARLDWLVDAGEEFQFVCLPELVTFLPSSLDDLPASKAAAEKLNGPTADMFAQYARRLKTNLVCGSCLIRREDGVFNTSLLFGPDGDLLADYDKIHLFDTPEYKESWFVRPGGKTALVKTGPTVVGLTICYDIRFPELYRTLALQGAEIIFCPAAFPAASPSPGLDHWAILTRAAALQNMVYIIGVNQFGIKGSFIYFGRSVVIDPWGIEISVAPNREGVIIAELDLDYLREMRRLRSPLDHRRPDLYVL